MSNLEHCFENAIGAIEEGKDYDTWFYEEVPRLNAAPFNKSWAVLTDESIINLKDIWELAVYTTYTYKNSICDKE